VKEKILVVDDERAFRKYLQTLLEVDGFDGWKPSAPERGAREGEEGRAARLHNPGCINAELNGLDTLKELMQVDRSLNVIMLSWPRYEMAFVRRPSTPFRSTKA